MTSSLLLSSLLTVEQCLERVTAADVAAVEDFASLSRRREYLTWRVMLYEHLGRKVEIEYADSAPIVVGENIYIGVSHTADMAAVVVGQNPCAVDIERKDRDITRVANRFFTHCEKRFATDNSSMVAIWCARECYYKFKRDRSVDILSGVWVAELDIERGVVTVESLRGDRLEMKIEQTAEHIVVYVL